MSSINTEENQIPTTAPTIGDVHKAIFSLDNNKSPGLDGMSPAFYKHYWHFIGIKVHVGVVDFFNRIKINTATNHTFIALIPKKPIANRVDQFKYLVQYGLQDHNKDLVYSVEAFVG